MSARDLAAWLVHAERLHPLGIDLSLERIGAVLARLDLVPPPFPVLTVGGTNGKGSCVAFLEAMLGAAGRRVGAYASPHLLRYTERVRIAGAEVEPEALADAFARVEAARGDIALTYFEFGTAAALVAFRTAGIEVAVLEVGLGGRLDAVNALEPRASIITGVALDHQDLLGHDREAIAFEKAGIFRAARPAVCGDADPPASLVERARALGAPLTVIGREARFAVHREAWDLVTPRAEHRALPLPGLSGAFQFRNASCAIAALDALSDELPVPEPAIGDGLRRARNPGRCERLAIDGGRLELLLDVAHNPDAAAALARELASSRCAGRTLAVFGVLADKDATGIARALSGAVDQWFAAGLEGPRGRSGAALAAALDGAGVAPVAACHDVAAALVAARSASRAGDRIVVCGSFLTVGAAMATGLYSR